MLDSDMGTWVWVVGWLIFGFPPVFYILYSRFASQWWEQGLDVPPRVTLTALLWGILGTAGGVCAAAVTLGLTAYLVVPAVIGIGNLLPSVSKDDLRMLAELILFAIPLAAAYFAMGSQYGENHSKDYPQSPSQQRAFLERLRRQSRH